MVSLTTIPYLKAFRQPWRWLPFATGVLAALLPLGRTTLLLFVISACVSLHLQRQLTLRVFAIVGCVFVGFFFLFAYALGKGGAEEGLLQNVTWNFNVYMLSGVAALNNFVAYAEPNIIGPLLAPRLLIAALHLGGGSPDVPITVYPFVLVPLPTNVYTAFFEPYHDGGWVGIVVEFFLIGWLSMAFFRRRNRSRVYQFLYSLSLYPLVMTIFEEQYLRAYPLWAMACVVSLPMSRFFSPPTVHRPLQ
jgi:oligosaccharide repeat unit polymerase